MEPRASFVETGSASARHCMLGPVSARSVQGDVTAAPTGRRPLATTHDNMIRARPPPTESLASAIFVYPCAIRPS
jgi:hypothetical protein